METILGLFSRLVLTPLAFLFTRIFGTFGWKPPRWLSWIGNKLREFFAWVKGRIIDFRTRDPRRFKIVATSLCVCLVAAIGGYAYYRSLPEPFRLSVSGTWPTPTPLEKDASIAPLIIRFSGSAAPLDLVGKEITEGFTVTPEIKGTWKWESDREIVFRPESDWPVGVKYRIKFLKGFLPKHVLLDNNYYDFESPSFGESIVKTEFYQDPVDPKMKKVVSTVKFTHPVDKSDFEKRIELKLKVLPATSFDDSSVTPFRFKVSYDEFAGEAYIHSDPVAIPPDEGDMLVRLLPGARSSRGGNQTVGNVDGTVHIPGILSYFRVAEISGLTVRNQQNEPERVVSIESSVGVKQGELAEHVEAYLLPVDRPAFQDRKAIRNYKGWNITDVGTEVLEKSQKLSPEWIPTEHEFSEIQSFKYTVDPGRFLFVRVKKGVKSFGDYTLSKTFEKVIRVDRFPREAKILHEGSILSLTGDKKLSIITRDVEHIQLEVMRLLPGSVNHLISQTYGTFQNPEFENYNFSFDNVSDRLTKIIDLPKLPPGKTNYSSVDFSEYINSGQLPRGLFFLKISSWNPKSKSADEELDKRLILITDLGVVVKKARNGSHALFVQNIRSGEPVPDAVVEILGRNGQPAFTAHTEPNGRAELPTFKELEREKAPTVFTVRKDDDFSFVPYNRDDRRLNLSRFDTGGIYTDDSLGSLSGYLFSDRGIYRPGDSVHVGMIVKSSNWAPIPSGVPLELAVTDPRGLEVKVHRFTVSGGGFEEFTYTSEENSPTGEYSFTLYLVRDNYRGSVIGSATVKVEEFQPDRMTITPVFSSLAKGGGWVKPDDLKAKVTLRNLFGTPAIGRRIKGSFMLSPYFGSSFTQYPDYRFYDPSSAKKELKSVSEDLENQTTNDSGEAEFAFNLARFEKATYRLSFLAEGFEAEGGRSVSNGISTIVSPLPYLVGTKADGDLTFIKKDGVREVSLIAVGPDLTSVAASDLTLDRIEERYVSVLTKQKNGTYAYQSVKKEIPLGSEPLSISATGLKRRIDTSTPGNYALIIKDSLGTELNRVSYSVVGDGNVTRSLERNAELQIKLNKNDFAPGEDIEVQVQAPYAGAGLITIERDKVYSHIWFKADTTASLQRIRVPEELEGNGYVNVTFVRSLGSPEIFMSPLSYGVAPFSVSRERRTTHVTIESPEKVRPGERLSIGYSTNHPAKIAVFGIDEGILQVARYKTPDPLSYFFRKRALEVDTFQILDLILPEFELVRSLSAPGGDEDSFLGKNLNPFKRKSQKPVAFWSGIIDADSTARTVTYDVPDYFNGTIRVMAVAVADGSVGVSEKKSLVQGHFVINPNAPLFIAPGDQADVSVVVANNVEGSGADSEVKVAIDAGDGLEVVGEKEHALKISEGHDAVSAFQIRGTSKLGSASLKFSAEGLGKHATYTTDLSVRPAVPRLTTLQTGYFKRGFFKEGKVDVPIERSLFTEEREMTASASSLPLGISKGLLQYLEKYPHGCTEQILSQTLPAVVMKGQPDFGYDPDKVYKSVTRALSMLSSRQNDEGAFGLWAANSEVSDPINDYAVQFLLEAKERGFEVPGYLLDRAVQYLRTLPDTSEKDINGFRTRAYALYLITRMGQVTTRDLGSLVTEMESYLPKIWKSDIAGVYVAATYKLLKLDKEADAIIQKAGFRTDVEADYQFYYDNLIHNAQYLYIISKHFPNEVLKITPDSLEAIVGEVQKDAYNTLSSSYTILALDAYAKAIPQEVAKSIAIFEVHGDGSEKVLPTKGELFPSAPFTEDALSVRFRGDSATSLFYQVMQSGFDRDLPTKEIKDSIEVVREYRNEKGTVVRACNVGEKLHVVLKVRSIDNKEYWNVAVIDLLPGGFEVDMGGAISSRHSAESGPNVWEPDYIDVREDRVVIYGYVGPEAKEFVYTINATNKGTFIVPPIMAEDMYDLKVRSRSLGGSITVSSD